ncbi:MAG TPA: antitoxin Xre/MbcA/ParS toxin-binding domain-containing protein [Actinomycetota bacterium]|nr:antitoxin Xre/MbcA/ParS toxin-binding domain-containing protein [Actinomycetota bacterium]
MIDQLGNNRLAKLMAVSPSQPSRWRAGKEGIGPENQRRLIDLDYVFGRLEQLFTPRQAEIWLTSSNAHLGARPIDVLRVRGATPVIAAIDAEAEGAFA